MIGAPPFADPGRRYVPDVFSIPDARTRRVRANAPVAPADVLALVGPGARRVRGDPPRLRRRPHTGGPSPGSDAVDTRLAALPRLLGQDVGRQLVPLDCRGGLSAGSAAGRERPGPAELLGVLPDVPIACPGPDAGDRPQLDHCRPDALPRPRLSLIHISEPT